MKTARTLQKEKKLLELSAFSKVTGCRVNIQEAIAFSNTGSKQLEIEV